MPHARSSEPYVDIANLADEVGAVNMLKTSVISQRPLSRELAQAALT
jgi:hypothetical protein